MSASKAKYPERLPKPRPKKPAKGKGRPSSEKNSKRAKSWLSRNDIPNDKVDASAPTSNPWWKCPMMKAERLYRAATRR